MTSKNGTRQQLLYEIEVAWDAGVRELEISTKMGMYLRRYHGIRLEHISIQPQFGNRNKWVVYSHPNGAQQLVWS